MRYWRLMLLTVASFLMCGCQTLWKPSPETQCQVRSDLMVRPPPFVLEPVRDPQQFFAALTPQLGQCRAVLTQLHELIEAVEGLNSVTE